MDKKFFNLTIFTGWCKSCRICAEFCPKGVIECDFAGTPEIVRPDDCIGCYSCELRCPDFAIIVREKSYEKISGGK